MGTPAAEADAVPSPMAYTMLELQDGDEEIFHAFLCNGSRYFVFISATDLGDGPVLERFNEFLNDFDNPDAMFDFEEWILDVLKEFIPRFGSQNPRLLLDFYSMPTFAFKMVNKDGKLHPILQEYDPRVHGETSPRTRIVDDRLGDFNDSPEFDSDKSISMSSLPPVPLIQASQIELITEGLEDFDLMMTPRKVRRVGNDSQILFFKPALGLHGHMQELETLSRIHRSGKYESPFRTSRLVGLVVWDHDDKSPPDCWMGFLMEYIHGETLEKKIRDDVSPASKSKWIQQVQATVNQLHQDDIVWGDVKPDNILINGDGDAVVVDFGGGYAPTYVKRELHQTKEGDRLGLKHIAEEMGVSL